MLILLLSGAVASTVLVTPPPSPPSPGADFDLVPRVPIFLNLIPNQ